ncbi:MAG: tryptophan halogenase family protein [Acidimicrobiia bacterium]
MPRVQSVLIVGGGSSGWMAASGLQHARPELDITLVESSDVPTVGVGEATLNSFHSFLLTAGLHEDEFLYDVGGAIKLGIRYRGWSARDYWHPFGEVMFPRAFVDRWMTDRAAGGVTTFDEYGGLGTSDLAAAYRAPKMLGDPEYETRTVLYGYHMDAGLFAEKLKLRARSDGVRHVVDHVVGVERGPEGIAGVQTREHGALTADLYLDCSGFRSLLLGGAIGEPFESFSQYLPNDSAVAFGRMRGTENPLRPFTTANAMRHGWSWNIPLWGRDGTGYVYSSAFCEPAEAEREMVEFLGTEAPLLEANHLKMRVGKSRRTWVDNCVGVGLAGGFIEPLESTGLLTVEIGVDQIAQTLAGGDYDDRLRDAFNDGFSRLYDNIRDFLVLHFHTAARRDSEYWRACTTDPLMVPPRVAEFVERWKNGEAPWSAPWPFAVGSWMYILDGNGVPPGAPGRTAHVDPEFDARANERRAQRLALLDALPSTREFLRDVCTRYEAGERFDAPLPTLEAVWEANYARSFWRPEHEKFVHGVR